MTSACQRNICMPMFIMALFAIAKIYEIRSVFFKTPECQSRMQVQSKSNNCQWLCLAYQGCLSLWDTGYSQLVLTHFDISGLQTQLWVALHKKPCTNGQIPFWWQKVRMLHSISCSFLFHGYALFWWWMGKRYRCTVKAGLGGTGGRFQSHWCHHKN